MQTARAHDFLSTGTGTHTHVTTWQLLLLPQWQWPADSRNTVAAAPAVAERVPRWPEEGQVPFKLGAFRGL